MWQISLFFSLLGNLRKWFGVGVWLVFVLDKEEETSMVSEFRRKALFVNLEVRVFFLVNGAGLGPESGSSVV